MIRQLTLNSDASRINAQSTIICRALLARTAGGVTLSTGLAADTHLEAVDKNEKKRLLHFKELI